MNAKGVSGDRKLNTGSGQYSALSSKRNRLCGGAFRRIKHGAGEITIPQRTVWLVSTICECFCSRTQSQVLVDAEACRTCLPYDDHERINSEYCAAECAGNLRIAVARVI